MRGMMLFGGALAVVLVIAGCPTLEDPSFGGQPNGFKCAQGSVPCGNGCMPAANNNVCCAFEGSTTSSYCTSGSCFDNPNKRCGDSQFCCSPSGTIGSDDCPAGQKHCGLGCVPSDQTCCRDGQTCASMVAFDSIGCTSVPSTATGCAVCLPAKQCMSCPEGSCCKGDPCNGGGCATCPAHGPTGSSSSGGSSSGGAATKGLCATSCTTCSGPNDPKCDSLGGTCCGTAPLAYCTDLTVSGCFPCEDDAFCAPAKCCKGTGGDP
jgi:hypothetical protein